MARDNQPSKPTAGQAGRVAAGLLCGLLLCLLSAEVGPKPAAAEPSAASAEPLPAKDPVAFLEKCLKHLGGMKLNGYITQLHKQERLRGQLGPAEDIEVLVRLRPRGLFMRWLGGAGQADRALYVEGENDGKLLVHPTGLVGDVVKVVALDPNGARARQSSRYSITEVGLRHVLVRTLEAWRAGREKGVGKVEYLGVSTPHDVGDRPCYTLRRTTDEPDEDGVTRTTVYIDKETWFQVGTVLEGQRGELLGAYYYRDVVLNPEFATNQFQPSAVLP